MNLEDYIKDLAPELQEKARACSSIDELIALAKEAGVPVPDEALEAVAGGTVVGSGTCFKKKCPKCGGTRIGYQYEIIQYYEVYHYSCAQCGYEWTEKIFIDV